MQTLKNCLKILHEQPTENFTDDNHKSNKHRFCFFSRVRLKTKVTLN